MTLAPHWLNFTSAVIYFVFVSFDSNFTSLSLWFLICKMGTIISSSQGCYDDEMREYVVPRGPEINQMN